MHILVAGFVGYKGGGSAASIDEAAEFVPVQRVSAEEFDEVLKGLGLPTE